MDVRRHRLLAWVAYGVAAILVVFPLLDSVLGLWPPRLGDVQWRFGALGLFSRALLTPTLGMLLGILTAVTFDHRGRLKALSVVAFGGALVGLAIVGVFVLDAMQTRTQVVQEAMASFNTAAGVAIMKYLIVVLLLTMMGLVSWSAARSRAGRGSGRSGKGPGLVVGESSPSTSPPPATSEEG